MHPTQNRKCALSPDVASGGDCLSPSALGGTEWKRLPDGGFGCPARTWRAHSELRPVLRRPGEGGTPRSELRTQDAPQSALNGSNLIQPNPAKKNSAAAASAVTCHPTSLAAVVELRPLRLVVPKRRGGSSAKRWGGGTGSASRTCANLAGSGVRASVWTAASSAPLWSVHPLVVRRPVSDAVVLNGFDFLLSSSAGISGFRFQVSVLFPAAVLCGPARISLVVPPSIPHSAIRTPHSSRPFGYIRVASNFQSYANVGMRRGPTRPVFRSTTRWHQFAWFYGVFWHRAHPPKQLASRLQ